MISNLLITFINYSQAQAQAVAPSAPVAAASAPAAAAAPAPKAAAPAHTAADTGNRDDLPRISTAFTYGSTHTGPDSVQGGHKVIQLQRHVQKFTCAVSHHLKNQAAFLRLADDKNIAAGLSPRDFTDQLHGTSGIGVHIDERNIRTCLSHDVHEKLVP